MSFSREQEDARIEELAPRCMEGDPDALAELRMIYERGNFDPGFGREIDAVLAKWRDRLGPQSPPGTVVTSEQRHALAPANPERAAKITDESNAHFRAQQRELNL